MAFNSPEVEILGITTVYGNVPTALATRNAIRLRELAGRREVPVAEGSHVSYLGAAKNRIADFVHGSDGFGNTDQPPPEGRPVAESAAQFIVDTVNAHPGEVTILALAPFTNLALALQWDPSIAAKVGKIVMIGGAVACNGNVNPAAEANMFGDPEAADVVLGCAANTYLIGLDVTHSCFMPNELRETLQGKAGRFAQMTYDITEFYMRYTAKAFGKEGVFLHDPACLAGILHPEWFTWQEGAVRVCCDGIARGQTVMDLGLKNWVGDNPWLGRPPIKVAREVDAEKVVAFCFERFSR